MSTSLAGSSYADGPTRPEPADFQYGAKTFDGKRVLATGGTRGMGAAIAELLIAQKARVIVTARHQVAFLVSDAAAYITGSEFVIDGGNNRVL